MVYNDRPYQLELLAQVICGSRSLVTTQVGRLMLALR